MEKRIIALLHEHGLTRIAGPLEQAIRASIKITTRPAREGENPTGRSRLGGLPDLPPALEWPTWKGEPLAFIAQFNLAELPPAPFPSVLPGSGLLSFFYSAGQETWGFDPADRGSWRVIHCSERGLERRGSPAGLPDTGRFRPCSVSFEPCITVPGWESIAVGNLTLSGEEGDRFDDWYEQVVELLDNGGTVHRLLGHPDTIQGDMQLECQLVSHGLTCGDPSGYRDPRAEQLRAGATEWELLLQVDSDRNAGMMWGDVGRLYFSIARPALERRDWDAVWMILQCC